MQLEDNNEKIKNIKRRLKRIEGQLRGIIRMLDEDACCLDVLVQVAAVRAAISKVGIIIFENHTEKCLTQTLQGEDIDREKALADLVNVMNNFIK